MKKIMVYCINEYKKNWDRRVCGQMRKISIIVMLFIGIIGLVGCSSNNSEVIVKSKAGNITKDEFYEELKDSVGEKVLEDMIVVKVLQDKFEVKEEDVEAEIDKFKSQFNEQFDMWLAEQGFANEEDFRKAVRISMLYEQAVYGDVEISEDEIKERYERMQSEIEAQHILVADEEEAKEIKGKLDDGEDFDKLAKEFSMDPGSAEDGGKLGFFTAGKMVKEFEDAAYRMEVDEISDPVQTVNGFHIIKVTDKRDNEAELDPLEDMKNDIINQLKLAKVDNEEGQAKINKLIEEANVDIKIKDLKNILSTEG